MGKVQIKTKKEIEAMREGGARLAELKRELYEMIEEDVSAAEVEKRATGLIEKAGGEPSFRMVPGYSWSTCINVNEGVVHGIPHEHIKFKEGDLVSVDVGIYYKGFHTDTSFTKLIGSDPEKREFLNVGRRALKKAVKQARVGKKIGDISAAIEAEITKGGYSVVRDLTGHGVGRDLHEAPLIPCFVSGTPHEKVKIELGMALAIEVMYVKGRGELAIEEDGWTIRTQDGKISALFEETVVVTPKGSQVLTQS